ncbi:DNA gyrase subunit A, partial [Patescibacteria group bacterium]|nr:DNA gyrase subunit A [Patescibacteria group bacterium]
FSYIIKEESEEIKRKYGDERLTKIVSGKVGTFETEDIIENKKTLITISNQGYIKRLSPDTYKTQHRGGKGIIGMTTKSEDYISHLLLASTLDDILFFSNKGRVFQTKVYEVPEFLRTAKGQPLVNIINLERDEIVTSVLIKNKDEMNGTKYLLMATKNGIVKKTNIEAFNNIRKNGLIAIKLDSGDELKWVMKTSGKDEVILVTKMASSIRFKEVNVRETGRASRGVKGIKIKKDDVLIGADLITKDGFILVVSENGFSKKTSEAQHLVQNRG